MRNILAKVKKLVLDNKPLVLFLFVIIFLRFYALSEHITFLGDQGRDAIIIKRIVKLERLPLIGPSMSVGGVFLGPFYYYLMSPFLFLFNFNPIGLGYGVAIISVVSIILIYFILRVETNKAVATISTFLLTISAALTDLSRYSWNPNLLPYFSFFTLYFFYKSLKSKGYFFPFLFGMFFSLSMQLHYLVSALVVVFALFTIAEYFKTKSPLTLFKKNIISVISFFVFYSPLIIFDLRHDFINSKSFLKIFNSTNEPVIPYFNRLFETATAFVKLSLNVNVSGSIALLLIVLITFAAIMLAYRSKSLLAAIFASCSIIYILVFSILPSNRHIHYFTPIYLSFFISIAFILATRWKSCKICKYFILLLLLFLSYTNLGSLKYILVKGSNPVPRARKIASSIFSEVKKDSFQMVALPYTESDAPYRYFIEIMGKTPLPEDTIDNPDELFVLCFENKCEILNNGQWQIAAFSNKKVEKSWVIEGIRVYKVVHKKT
jgi:hypothetical protein